MKENIFAIIIGLIAFTVAITIIQLVGLGVDYLKGVTICN